MRVSERKASDYKPHVVIKGTKDKLRFVLSAEVPWEQLLEELVAKLNEAEEHFFRGADFRIVVDAGTRVLTLEEQDAIRQIFSQHGRMQVHEIYHAYPQIQNQHQSFQVVSGTLRSGQEFYATRDVLWLGDVNPGAIIHSPGDVLVLGSLRGIAHAGCEGNTQSIVAASLLMPSQLRIAGYLGRSPDEWPAGEGVMQFAYLSQEGIVIEGIHLLKEIRPAYSMFANV